MGRFFFCSAALSMQDILKVVLWKVGQWPNGRMEFGNFDFDNILSN